MGQKLFRTALFGFKKKDVNEYLMRASEKFDQKLTSLAEQKDAEADSLTRRLDAANEQIKELLSSKEEYEKAKGAIAEAILQAQRSAAAIEADAKKRANAEAAEISESLAREKELLYRYKNEASSLRREVASAIKRFSSDLTSHLGQG